MARDLLHYNIPRKKYRSSKTFKKQMEAANKRLAAFGKAGFTSNEAMLYQNMIRAFNIKVGLQETDQFDPNKWYTKEQQKEIRDIVKSIYKNKLTSVPYWKKFFKDIKNASPGSRLADLNDMFDFQNVQELMTWKDNSERYKSSILSEILTSEQYQDLVEYADQVQYKDIEKKIKEIYKKTGYTKTNLYNTVFKLIEEYDKQQAAQEEAVKNMWG